MLFVLDTYHENIKRLGGYFKVSNPVTIIETIIKKVGRKIIKKQFR